MANSKNKVKFGLKNVYYAKATFDEDGNVTYDTPVRIPRAVNFSMDPEGGERAVVRGQYRLRCAEQQQRLQR